MMPAAETYLANSQANPRQRAAIEATEGPVLVIAGPGAGKTMTLVERIVYLVLKGISPEEIMVATFTEKAAKELITRVSNRLLELELQVNLNEMYIGTLHSIFLRILEENRAFTRLKRSYRLLDDFDQKYLLYREMKRFETVDQAHLLLEDSQGSNRWKRAQNLVHWINKVGEECLDYEVLIRSERPSVRALGYFSKIYQDLLEEENALDFSTIQTETLLLLENNRQILESIQAQIRYFMVDEYQDTNTVQEKILLLLSSKNNNLCVVGDDDQGLYRFRGATIRNILEFPNNFQPGECTQIILDTNYRSHPSIIQFYNQWMDTG